MKTLLVTYLPSGRLSNTRKLVDAFIEDVGPKTTLETLDLLRDSPPLFSEESIAAYYKRNYRGEALSATEANLLSTRDRLTHQFKSADIIVMAYPMHNFSMPAAVKAYFDSVMQAGETFKYGPSGPEGTMQGKNALTIFTSGGIYPHEKVSIEYPYWDTLTMLAKIEFSFMRFAEAEVVGTSLRDPELSEKNFDEAGARIKKVVDRWY